MFLIFFVCEPVHTRSKAKGLISGIQEAARLGNGKSRRRVMLALTETSKVEASRWPPKRGQTKRPSPMNILVVDDHFLIRDALRDWLKRLNSEATVLEAANGHQAIELVSEHTQIQLVLLELNLPDRDGFSVLSELRERHPTVSVVVVSARQDPDSVARAFDLGALGFIPKSERLEVLLSALELVFAGGTYIPSQFLLCEARSSSNPNAPFAAGGVRPRKLADFGLTGRQLDVLELMMKGKSNKAICRELNRAEPTVKNHVTAILKALKVMNRTEAVIAVSSLG
jgi:DNA-binding NarL/FixJ family response regulator